MMCLLQRNGQVRRRSRNCFRGGVSVIKSALEELTPLVYDELRRLAHRHMGGARPDHTLQTTALVNEAYLKFAQQTHPNWSNRVHFFAVAARAMRQILINYALSYNA